MTYLGGARALRVFTSFAAGYLLSYALRSINAVIAPALMNDIGLSNSDLGLLSSAYLVAFGCLQLPLGIWLDKYGPRRTESALLLFAAAGAAIFAVSTTLPGLWIGRAMIGIGVSSCLMAPFKAYRSWYAPQRQSQLASLMLVAGTSGALIATVPVSAALPYIGWRGVFWVISALILLVAATLFLVLRDVEREMDIQAAAVVQAPQVHGYRLIFGDPYFRRMAVLGLVNQGIFIALQTLWAGPWMMTVLDMSRAETAQILFVFNFFLLLGYVALSWWGPRYVSQSGGPGWSFVSTVAWGLFGSLLIQLAILLCTASWSWLLWLALAGFVTVTTLVQTHVSLSFPSSLAGRANSAYNLLLFIGAFLAQWGIGVLIDLFVVNGATPQLAMRAAFAVCLALQAVALLAFVSNRAQHRLAAA